MSRRKKTSVLLNPDQIGNETTINRDKCGNLSRWLPVNLQNKMTAYLQELMRDKPFGLRDLNDISNL